MAIDVKVLTALIGISGTAIAAMLSSFGYLYRNRTEHKRSTRKALYLLLEIHHSIRSSLFDPDKATAAYINYLTEKYRRSGIGPEQNEFPKAMREIIRTHFDNLNSATRTDIRNRLVQPFEDALMEVAQVNPVLAYKIRGTEKWGDLIAHTNTYSDNVRAQFDTEISEEQAHNLATVALDKFEENAFKELLQELNKDILMLAKSSGYSDYHKCEQILAKNAEQMERQYDFSKLDKYLEEAILMLSKSV